MWVNSINKKTFFIISVLFLQIPFLEFINKNFKDFNQIIVTLISLYFVALLFGIIFSKILNYTINRKFNDCFFSFTFCFFIFFKWFDTTLLFDQVIKSYSAYVSLFLITIAIIAIFYFVLIKNKILIKSIFFTFFSVYIIFLVSNIIVKSNFFITTKVNQNILNENIISSAKINKKVNIYYIIFDGMISPSRFENIFNSENILKDSDLNTVDFKTFNDVYSSYFDTGLSIGSVLNLDYISEVFDKMNHKNLYPENLSKSNLVKKEPNLLKIIKNNGYEFVWYSNSITSCRIINNKLCGKVSRKFLDNYLNVYVSMHFLRSSPIIAIINKIDPNILIKIHHGNNDAVKDFLDNNNFYNDDQKRFFLIHSMMPHSPFVYNYNCELVNNEKKLTIGYKMNYLCALKRIKEFQNFIMSKDKNALVVIQADHGYYFKDKKIYNYRNDEGNYIKLLYENNKSELLENYKIFNMIKNNNCKLPQSKILDNVNSIIFTLNCALKTNIRYKQKKTYYDYNNLIY